MSSWARQTDVKRPRGAPRERLVGLDDLRARRRLQFGRGQHKRSSPGRRAATEPARPQTARLLYRFCHTLAAARLKLPVTKQPATGNRLGAEVERMVHDLFLDGLTRRLERRYPDAPDVMCEDAVYEAVAKLLKAGERREIENPRGYLTTVAINEMRRALSRAAREVLPDDDEDDAEWYDAATPPDSRPTEVTAVGGAVYSYVKGLVEQWESQKLKAATLLVLEGAYIGEPLTGSELAERLSDILGDDVAEHTARQWRKRGLDRLRSQLAAEGFPIEE